jgi:hypothetical protein
MHPEKTCTSLCKVSVKILQFKEIVNIYGISALVSYIKAYRNFDELLWFSSCVHHTEGWSSRVSLKGLERRFNTAKYDARCCVV